MRRLGVIAIVVIGLLTLEHAVMYAMSMTGVYGLQLHDATPRQLILGTGVLAVALALAILFGAGLIAWRHRLAERWFGDDEVGLGIDVGGLLRIGLILLGSSMVMDAVLMFATSLPSMLLQPSDWEGGRQAFWFGELLTYALRIAAGVVLVWFSEPLASALLRPRHGRRTQASGRAHCPSCGAAYDPDDYREGTDAACVSCHAPLPVASNNGIERTPSALD